MSLRAQQLADLAGIVGNSLDFGQDITLTDPAGATTDLVGLTGDISTSIDPDSGALVKGRTIHVTIQIADLPAGPRPATTNDRSLKPWLVSFPRVTTGAVTQYAVIASDPDDAVGTIVLELGVWNPLP